MELKKRNNKKSLTIIIPVFNTDFAYFDELCSCLSKVNNIEVIMIDDCSLENKSKHYEQKCLDKEWTYLRTNVNEGVSYCRNLGLSRVQTKYVMFVDSDDLISFSVLNDLKIENCEYDLAAFRASHFTDSIEDIRSNRQSATCKPVRFFCDDQFNDYLNRSACSKIFNYHLIRTNKIQFPDNIRYNEDTLFLLTYLSKIDELVLYDDIFYFCRINLNSASRSFKKDYLYQFNNVINNYKSILNYFTKSEQELLKTKISENFLGTTLPVLVVTNFSGASYLHRRKEFRELIRSNFISTSVKWHKKSENKLCNRTYTYIKLNLIWLLYLYLQYIRNKYFKSMNP